MIILHFHLRRVRDSAVSSHVYVIEGNAESLLGRDSNFKLRVLTQVNSVHQESDNAELTVKGV